MGTMILLFESESFGLIRLKLNCLITIIMVMSGGKRGSSQSTFPAGEYGGTVSWFGAPLLLHKIDNMIMEILMKQHLKTSLNRFKLK